MPRQELSHTKILKQNMIRQVLYRISTRIFLAEILYFRDVSLLSSQSVRNNNPPAMRVRDRCYTKKSPFRSIIELFKLNNTNRKVILWLIKRTAYLTQNGCANII